MMHHIRGGDGRPQKLLAFVVFQLRGRDEFSDGVCDLWVASYKSLSLLPNDHVSGEVVDGSDEKSLCCEVGERGRGFVAFAELAHSDGRKDLGDNHSFLDCQLHDPSLVLVRVGYGVGLQGSLCARDGGLVEGMQKGSSAISDVKVG